MKYSKDACGRCHRAFTRTVPDDAPEPDLCQSCDHAAPAPTLLRLPGPTDPLTTFEQKELEEMLSGGVIVVGRKLLEPEVQNIHRQVATLKFYREVLASAGVNLDKLLPKRTTLNGIDYLPEATP
jgi:hypothetical protein